MGESDPNTSENRNSGSGLTPEKAHKLYNEKGLTQSQIAEKFGISQPRVSQILSAFNTGKEKGRQEVKENPEEYELTEMIDDEEPDSNPYDNPCPNCGEPTSPPDSPGTTTCDSCGVKLHWSADEI